MPFRSALITGASGGIGTAFARALPAQTHLLLTGRDAGYLNALATQLALPGRRVETVAADLAAASGREAVIRAAQRADIDLFICNAGVGKFGCFGRLPLSTEQEIIAVNITAVVELLHALVPPMRNRVLSEGRRGGIIVVSSALALAPSPGLASYGASKAFLLHLIRSLSVEMAVGSLDFLALCPTATKTKFFARAGLPLPSRTMSPDAVAREALAVLGRRPLHLCGTGSLWQPLRQLLALNQALDPRYWCRCLSWRLRRGWKPF